MNETALAQTARAISISPGAAKRVRKLVDGEGNQALMLRVSVSGGGCSGFQYGFDLDDKVNDDDAVFEKNGIKVVIDETSLDFLAGSEVDFVEDLVGSFFAIKNPNATSTCGCGSSFAV